MPEQLETEQPQAETELRKFDVHVFDVVRVKIEGVEATSIQDAIRAAGDLYDPYNLHQRLSVTHRDGNTGHVEYSEDVSHYLVDPHVAPDVEGEEIMEEKRGDETVRLDYGQSHFLEDDGKSDLPTTPAHGISWKHQYREGIDAALTAMDEGRIGDAENALVRSLETVEAAAAALAANNEIRRQHRELNPHLDGGTH